MAAVDGRLVGGGGAESGRRRGGLPSRICAAGGNSVLKGDGGGAGCVTHDEVPCFSSISKSGGCCCVPIVACRLVSASVAGRVWWSSDGGECAMFFRFVLVGLVFRWVCAWGQLFGCVREVAGVGEVECHVVAACVGLRRGWSCFGRIVPWPGRGRGWVSRVRVAGRPWGVWGRSGDAVAGGSGEVLPAVVRWCGVV